MQFIALLCQVAAVSVAEYEALFSSYSLGNIFQRLIQNQDSQELLGIQLWSVQ